MIYLFGSVLFAIATGAALAQHAFGAAVAYGILCAMCMTADCYFIDKED